MTSVARRKSGVTDVIPMKEVNEMIKVGEKVPEIVLEGTNGESVSLKALADQGKKLVLFFYPKDNTSG